MPASWKVLLIILIIVAVTAYGLSLARVRDDRQIAASTLLDAAPLDTSGFARAIAPYDWEFPADFGAHPRFQTEWWYYTGNVATDEGRRFGFQFTIFRRAITPESSSSASEWRSNQIYLAHFTVSDIEGEQFLHDQRLSRAGAGLAGAEVDPRYRVWVEDWEIRALNDDASQVAIRAQAGNFGIDLTLEQTKPPALHGDQGLSQKSTEPGNASYYYSLSRLITTGTITIDDIPYDVSGVTWKDHEFSTSALGDNARGWDWFGLIFDDGSELMVGKIRMVNSEIEPAFGGLWIEADGSTQYLGSDQFTIAALDTWVSPHTGAEYPSGWTIGVQRPQGTIQFDVEPLLRDQELSDTDPSYWEGAVRISGDVSGYGYAELTGYTTSMQDRF